MKNIFLLFFISLSCSIFAQEYTCRMVDPAATPREHSVDMEHMRLEAKFEPEIKKVIGKVSHTFTVLRDSITEWEIDAPEITISKVSMNNQNLKFETKDKMLHIYFDKALKCNSKNEVSIEYTAFPKKGIYFIGWDVPEQNNTNPYRIRRQIWTQGQGIDNRYWIPMYDDANDKFTTETIITFDSKYKVLSNGLLKNNKKNSDQTNTWHYAMSKPHAGYLLMLGIGDYKVKTVKSKKGTPLNFWYYPDLESWVEPTYRYTSEMFDVLESETGVNYPWESYSQIMVQDFLYGAMENTTATIFGDFLMCDDRQYLDRNYVSVNCHELTHQWFGDYITHRSFADIWLHESFATHYPKVFFRGLKGEEEYEWIMYNEMKQALNAGKNDNKPVRYVGSGTARIYPKGSVVISMMKYVMSDASFNRALNYYMTTHAYKNVETNDLYQAVQDKVGYSLDWFFNQWLYNGGEPVYQIKWNENTSESKRKIDFTIKQVQATTSSVGYFKMPVDIQVYFKDGKNETQRFMVENSISNLSFATDNKSGIEFIIFDKGNHILKEIQFERTPEMLMKQALKAEKYIDRLLAVEALKETGIEVKRQTLTDVYNKETHYAIKNEILTQLKNDDQSEAVFLAAYKSNYADIRKTAIQNTWKNDRLISAAETLLTDSSYNICEFTLDKLILLNPSETENYLQKTANNYGAANANRIKWLQHKILSLKQNTENEYTKELANYASVNFEFRTRINAFEAIKKLNLFNSETFAAVVNATTSLNSRLAGPANQCLESLFVNEQNKYMATSYAKGLKLSKEQTDILKKLGMVL